MARGPEKKKRRRSRYRFGISHVPLAESAAGSMCLLDSGNTRASVNYATLQSPGISPILQSTTGFEQGDISFEDDVEIDLTMCDRASEYFEDEPAQDETNSILRNSTFSLLQDPILVLNGGEGDSSVPKEIEGAQITPLHSSISNTAINSPLKIDSWRVLWGILVTTGSLKLTKDQYQAMRIMADTFMQISEQVSHGREENAEYLSKRRIEVLPHFSTLYKTYKPILFRELAVRGARSMVEVNSQKAGARPKSYSQCGTPLVPFNTILPSEFARADVACEPVFNLMRGTSLDESSNFPDHCLDLLPLIFARSWFYGPRAFLSVDEPQALATSNNFAEYGDTISISLVGSGPLPVELSENFAQGADRIESNVLVGEILHIWTVHSEKRRGDADFMHPSPDFLSQRDKAIIAQLQFSSYTSPNDSVQVQIPELPRDENEDTEDDLNGLPTTRAGRKDKRASPEMREAIRLRNIALRNQRKEIDLAWANWQKPLVKPADLVAILKPRAPITDSGCRLLLVHRFWAEEEERSRHVLWVDAGDIPHNVPPPLSGARGFSSFSVADACPWRGVTCVELLRRASTARGPYRFSPVSSYGTLSTGETYFIYRFLLFWDGFEIQRGKSASGEGVYLVPLNLPVHARSSPSAVRIISLTPPGVRSSAVLDLIQGDIITGMTEGYLDIDAHGNKIRIFLDLVAFLGDTPAINAALDVLEHTGNACCHLCRYVRRSKTRLGSRYTRRGFHGMRSGTGRGFYQHCAIIDSDAKGPTTRSLGISSIGNAEKLPLHKLRSAMCAVRDAIPKTNKGERILSGHLDPYLSCLIAPDHLLSGHFRDCVNAAFRLLPTTKHREASESYMIGLLTECNLPKQNRLFDFGKKSLLSMSVTELYAISVVAHQGFLRACASFPTPLYTLGLRSRLSIGLVASCSALIAKLWHQPSIGGKRKLPRPHLASIQEETVTHLTKVEELCSMADADWHFLQQSGRGPYRATLNKDYRDCLVAIKAVDKPNVHRLYELVYSTLPMVGFVSRVGELVLEKTHQSLKRAISQSNNKDVQLQSVLSSAFSDWQGSLTLQVAGALSNETNAVRGCFRLLAGREAIALLRGRLDIYHSDLVRHALGPTSCVPALLRMQSKSVLSPRADKSKFLSWALEKNIESTGGVFPLSTEIRSKCYSAFKGVCRITGSDSAISFGDVARSSVAEGALHLCLTVGDVLQVQCFHSTNWSAQFPVVSQHTSLLYTDPVSASQVLCFGRELRFS